MALEGKIARLEDRSVVAVTGADARAFLDNMITNVMPELSECDGERAVFAGLLTPQGKILFEFFVVATPEGYLLDTLHNKAADLAKRLSMYKLRAKVDIRDTSADWDVWAVTAEHDTAFRPSPTSEPKRGIGFGSIAGALNYPDRRDPSGGEWRWLCPKIARDEIDSKLSKAGRLGNRIDFDGCRITNCIPEGSRDYPLGDTFPHEANWDRMSGVSFTKGCYVGQEVVARMQNKAVLRKRIVRISGNELATGAEIKHGDGVVGSVGTVAADGSAALAMLRLDRAVEALDKGQPLLCDGHPITPDAAAIDRYRADVANRPVIDL